MNELSTEQFPVIKCENERSSVVLIMSDAKHFFITRSGAQMRL